MVVTNYGRCPTEGYAKRYFRRLTGEGATGIRKEWQEERSEGRGQWRVITGYMASALETGDAQVSGGPRGETTRDWYAGTETGDAQVGG